jgi:glutathione S-transferase
MAQDTPLGVGIFGRSSSHFTRCVRIFAHELGVPYQLRPIFNLLSEERADYGGNPALKLPTLETESGSWFGALSICRELSRRAVREAQIVWPEEIRDSVAANAQELVLQGMSTEVTLVMSKLGSAASATPYEAKNRASLENSLTWLNDALPHTLGQLRTGRALSFFEVTLFCFVTHLAFRSVLDATRFTRLTAFCAEFARRESARSTEYEFDVA